jgi:hypothetical protein
MALQGEPTIMSMMITLPPPPSAGFFLEQIAFL